MNEPSARDLVLGLTLGIIDSRAAIAWADHWIAKLDNPPFWIIEISIAGSASAHDILKFIPDRFLTEEPSDDEFLGAAAIKYMDQGESLQRVTSLLMDRFCFTEAPGMNDIRSAIYEIDDELDWDAAKAAQTATEFLGKYLEDGRRQREKILNPHVATPSP